jgi:hypothetical protein
LLFIDTYVIILYMNMNIRKGCGIKLAAAIRNWQAIVMAGMALLTAVSCRDQVVVSEFEVPAGADMWFWVELTGSGEISAEYDLVRLLVVDSSRQLGAVSAYGANSTDGTYTYRYKITLPESYRGKTVSYAAEFTKKESKFDGSSYADFSNEIVKSLLVGFLKSRYYEFLNQDDPRQIPNQGETVQLKIGKTNLKLGYGPNSLTLASIDAPPIYVIHLDTSDIEQYGLTATLGIAAEKGSIAITDRNAGYGFAAPETDWILLLNPKKYTPGDPLTFWFTMERYPSDPCPCGDSCTCLVCPYDGVPLVVNPAVPEPEEVGPVKPEQKVMLMQPVRKDVNNVPSETGSTIDIKFEVKDIECGSIILPPVVAP